MMDVTKDGMTQHFDAYDKLKDQIFAINQQADDAINTLNFYEKDPPKISKKSELERILEDEAAEDISKNNKGKGLEGNKKDIVDTLLGMNQ